MEDNLPSQFDQDPEYPNRLHHEQVIMKRSKDVLIEFKNGCVEKRVRYRKGTKLKEVGHFTTQRGKRSLLGYGMMMEE